MSSPFTIAGAPPALQAIIDARRARIPAGMTLTAGPGFWLLLSVGAASALWGCALIVLEVAAMRWEDVDLGARHWALT